ncbi:MAG: hypothetical protein IPI69_10270 [Bacteroidales bacterium]|nr:hypothetical protein [Bacteroidales bacterium]
MGVKSDEDFTPTNHPLDPRVDHLIARRGVDFLGWGIHPGDDWIRQQSNGGPYMTKLFMHAKSEQSLNLNGSGFYNGKNYRTMVMPASSCGERNVPLLMAISIMQGNL